MTCQHNFAAWHHETLARLCQDLYRQNADLHQRLRSLTAAAGVVDDPTKGLSPAPAPTAKAAL